LIDERHRLEEIQDDLDSQIMQYGG